MGGMDGGYPRRVRRVLVGLAMLFALQGSSGAWAAPSDRLRIVVWPHGTESPALTARTLTCRPTGGTLAGAAAACARLARQAAPFASVPPGVACADVVSGPQVALVTGAYHGRRIWARFRRTDSCQTQRWNRVAFLFANR